MSIGRKILRGVWVLLVVALVLPLVLYAGAVGLVFAAERRLLFPAPHPVRAPEIPRSTLVRLPAKWGGPEVVALYVPPLEGGRVLVHFHDSRQQLADLAPLATTAADHKLGYFAVEYPGYGIAPGRPSEESLYAAANQALGYLQGTMGVGPDRVVLLGEGLGSGTAVEMALRGKGVRLALLSPFTSVVEIASGTLRWMPVHLIVRDKFDNLAKAKVIPIPALVVHAEKDTVFPIAMGERLARTFPQGRFAAVPEVAHDDVSKTGEALTALFAFAEEGFSPAKAPPASPSTDLEPGEP